MTKQQILNNALNLSDTDRRDLAEALLDSVTAGEGAVPPEWQKEFERRITSARADADSAMPLEEFLDWLDDRPAQGEREAG